MGFQDAQQADVESKASNTHEEKVDTAAPSKLDPHGFPLRPQPTNDPLDPLNWPYWLKLAVLIQVSFLACTPMGRTLPRA